MFNGSWFSPPIVHNRDAERTRDFAIKNFFRAVLTLKDLQNVAGEILISADSRYKFYLNGDLIATGPAKPNSSSWFVDPVQLPADLLHESNVIGVEVLTYRDDESGNASVLRFGKPSLYVQATGSFAVLKRPENWRVSTQKDIVLSQGVNTQFLGIQESVEGASYPHGWLTATFMPDGWLQPTLNQEVSLEPENLKPRSIPQLTFTPGSFASVSRQDSSHDWLGFTKGEPVEIGPDSEVVVDFDAGTLVTGFLNLQVAGGEGSLLTLEAAECYELPPIDIPWLRDKRQRDQSIGQDLYGDPDSYLVAGVGSNSHPESYQPFWFRTFRFLRLRIKTSGEPITLRALGYQAHNYPLDITGNFETSDSFHQEMWEVSKRTLLNCMHETFEDCPFYEQLQYAMDTRSQALFTMHLSDDDRLVRRAIEDFAVSGDLDGLTSSRAPSVIPQVIPNFSLFWIFMVHDHMMYRGDSLFLQPLLPRIQAVLSHFRSRLNSDSLVVSPSSEEVWNFVDWTEEWRATRGVPDLGQENVNTVSTFIFVSAIRKAAEIARFIGELAEAIRLESEAIQISEVVRAGVAVDTKSGLFRDSNSGNAASVHAQLWAVLAGVVDGNTAARVLRESLAKDGFAQCSYAMSLSLFDALQLAGLSSHINWQPWQEMLNLGLTTWAEDTVSNRSDCHAWGSVPLQHFPKYELGISPFEPGFAKVGIFPTPSQLSDARGTVPTPMGPIKAEWVLDRESGARNFIYIIPQEMAYAITDLAKDIEVLKISDEMHIRFRLED
jgi:alpha-L-rhamnosidase